MNYHYKSDIEKLKTACPPQNYKQISIECFRWVFDDIKNSKNFKAQADKNPKVINSKSDIEKCDYFALSFHDSEENSKKAFEYFLNLSDKAYKRLGTHIAVGSLANNDGVGGNINTKGHFNFHHIKEHCFESKFKIICEL